MSGETSPDLVVEFPDGFDDWAWEVEAKGWFAGVVAVIEGERFPLTVYDPVSLAQDVQAELVAGGPFAEPNLVVVPAVTRANIEAAVRALVGRGGWRERLVGAPRRPPRPAVFRSPYGPIQVLVGLEAIRVRPGMYIGPGRTTVNRLCAVAIAAMVRSGEGRNRVSAEVRADGSLTVRSAVALAPMGTVDLEGIVQPAILRAMLLLFCGRGRVHPWLDDQGCILAALSAQLGVSCRASGVRLDAWFAQGGLVSPVSRTADTGPDATAIGLLPDSALLTGTIDVAEVLRGLQDVAPECVELVALSEAEGDRWEVLGARLSPPSPPE